MSDREEYQDDDYEIQEERGWLPQWWMILFYGTVVVGIALAIYLHGFMGWSQEKQYAEEVAAHERRHPTVAAALTPEGANPFRGDVAAIAAGEKTFVGLCAACHKVDMTGLIGPNLVDRVWMHGHTDKELFQTIMEGIPADRVKQKPSKGPMPGNRDSLGARKVLEVLAFLASKNGSITPK